MTERLFKQVYAVLGIGLFLEFLGHGVWGIKGLEKFIPLVTGSADSFGISIGNSTALDIVHVIGYVDVVLAAVFALIVIGFFTDYAEIATSKLAIGLLVWASVWGFATAASRPLAGGWGDIWDLVERGPNFMLPLGLVAVTVVARRTQLGYRRREEKTPPAHARPTPA
jgi:hypothetical protein